MFLPLSSLQRNEGKNKKHTGIASEKAWGLWHAGYNSLLLYHTSKKDLQNENQETSLRCQSSNAQRDDDETSDASVRIP